MEMKLWEGGQEWGALIYCGVSSEFWLHLTVLILLKQPLSNWKCTNVLVLFDCRNWPSSVAAKLWMHHDSSDHLGAQGGTNDPRLLGGFPRCLGTRRCQSPRSRCQWDLEIGTGAPNPMVYHGLSWFIMVHHHVSHCMTICMPYVDYVGI